MTLPEETTIDDLCAKAASRMIVDRLYPDEDDNAFNEVSSVSSKDLLTGIRALSDAQETLKQETVKLSNDLKMLTTTFSESINQVTQQSWHSNNQTPIQNSSQNNNYQQQRPRYNNPNNWRGNKNRNPNNWQQPRYNNQNQYRAQPGQKHCNICNKFGHLPSQCWF